MSNLVITSTTNSIKVVFNDQPYTDPNTAIVLTKGCWSKNEIGSIKQNTNLIVVTTKDETEWKVSDDGYTGTFTIDSVDGNSPSSLSDLYDKLTALIG